jgi:ABC-type Zn2+ transport system substrate-binding protein/surface adhesin
MGCSKICMENIGSSKVEIMEYVARYVMEGRVTPQKEYREKKRSKGRKRVEGMRKGSGYTHKHKRRHKHKHTRTHTHTHTHTHTNTHTHTHTYTYRTQREWIW